MKAIIAGYGSIGKRHLANLRSLYPGANIALLRSGTSANSSIPDGADAVFLSTGDAVRFAPDVAIICTPAPFHIACARQMIAAGAHLLIEKPLADTLDGVDEMIAEAQARQRVVLVGYTLAFLPSVRFLRDFLQRNGIGRVLSVHAEVGQYLPDWRPGTDYRNGASARRELGGGALLELSHELHYLQWLFGPVQAVQAVMRTTGTLDIEVEDLVAALLQFHSGAIGTVQLDFVRRTYSRSCRIVGSEGTVEWPCVKRLRCAGQEIANLVYSSVILRLTATRSIFQN
jgi:predicted dehydrogenase